MKIIQIWLVIFFAILALSLISSRSANPDNSYLFGLKRVQEKAFLSTISDPRERVEYMRVLLDNRLKELGEVVNNKKYGEVLKASQRYATLAGEITDLITSNNLKDLVEGTKQQFEGHKPLIDRIYVIYPKNVPGDEEHKYIKDDYNYLDIYLEKLSKI